MTPGCRHDNGNAPNLHTVLLRPPTRTTMMRMDRSSNGKASNLHTVMPHSFCQTPSHRGPFLIRCTDGDNSPHHLVFETHRRECDHVKAKVRAVDSSIIYTLADLYLIAYGRFLSYSTALLTRYQLPPCTCPRTTTIRLRCKIIYHRSCEQQIHTGVRSISRDV